MRARVMFRITGWDEEPYDEAGDGARLTRAHVRRSFRGDLSGTGNLMYVMAHCAGGGALFTGFEKVAGSLDGRKGTFVLRHTGSYDGDTAAADCEVVPGSGTGELAGLSGTGGFAAGAAEEHGMTLDWEVAPPSPSS